VRPQALLHHPQEQAQRRTLESGIAVQEVAQALGHRQHPLAHRQRRQDVLGEMRRGRHHAPRVARGAHAAPLAGKGDEEVVPALPAARAGETVGEDAALEITAELPFHMFRHRPLIVVAVAALGEPGLEVLPDAAIEHGLARPAASGIRAGGTLCMPPLAAATRSCG